MAALISALARLFQPTMMLPGAKSDGNRIGLAPWYLLLGLRLVALLLANDPWSSVKEDLVCNWTKATMEQHLQPFCQALCFNQHFSSPITSAWGLSFLLGLFPVGLMGLIGVLSNQQEKPAGEAKEEQANRGANYAMMAAEGEQANRGANYAMMAAEGEQANRGANYAMMAAEGEQANRGANYAMMAAEGEQANRDANYAMMATEGEQANRGANYAVMAAEGEQANRGANYAMMAAEGEQANRGANYAMMAAEGEQANRGANYAMMAAEGEQANRGANYAVEDEELHQTPQKATLDPPNARTTWHSAAFACLVILLLVMELVFLWVLTALQIPLVSQMTFRCLLGGQNCPPILECAMLGQVDKQVALWGLIFIAVINVAVCLSCLLLRLVKILPPLICVKSDQNNKK